jgi:hypothetical protein
MATSGIGAQAPASQQLSQSSGHHKHHGHKVMSMTDVDGQSSSLASAASSSGKVGSKLNVRA